MRLNLGVLAGLKLAITFETVIWLKVERCIMSCNKIPFDSKADAMEYVRIVKSSYKNRKQPVKKLRAYECPYCGQYHLTSCSPNKNRIYRRKERSKC